MTVTVHQAPSVHAVNPDRIKVQKGKRIAVKDAPKRKPKR